jgi:hypothetical protein
MIDEADSAVYQFCTEKIGPENYGSSIQNPRQQTLRGGAGQPTALADATGQEVSQLASWCFPTGMHLCFSPPWSRLCPILDR